MTLDKLPVGETARIKTVGGEGALRLRLLDMGIIPNTRVTVVKIAPLGDPIQIEVRGYTLTLRLEDAARIALYEQGEEPAAGPFSHGDRPHHSLFAHSHRHGERPGHNHEGQIPGHDHFRDADPNPEATATTGEAEK